MSRRTHFYDLRTMRERKQLSVTALAKAIGVPRSTVYTWDTGRYEVPAQHRSKLREALGVRRLARRSDRSKFALNGNGTRHDEAAEKIRAERLEQARRDRAFCRLVQELCQLDRAQLDVLEDDLLPLVKKMRKDDPEEEAQEGS
jgi:transcriptional regulator with XRE-family HTH domain